MPALIASALPCSGLAAGTAGVWAEAGTAASVAMVNSEGIHFVISDSS